MRFWLARAENYYGECKFEIDVTTPDYLKLDRSVLKGLFGKFNPSRGDLVFSRTGQLLGIMANSTYCMMIRNFDPAATFQFGQDMRRSTRAAHWPPFTRRFLSCHRNCSNYGSKKPPRQFKRPACGDILVPQSRSDDLAVAVGLSAHGGIATSTRRVSDA